MRDLEAEGPSLRGHLLVAHPGLLDPNFHRTVVLISAHSREGGALGVIVNRPLDKTLGELKEEFADSPLGKVPLYEGGPVSREEVLLTAWRWDDGHGTFQLYFGLSPEKLTSLLEEDEAIEARGFVGYSGWGEGQVEGELGESAWVVVPIKPPYLAKAEEEQWRFVLLAEKPELGFLANAPDDPSVN